MPADQPPRSPEDGIEAAHRALRAGAVSRRGFLTATAAAAGAAMAGSARAEQASAMAATPVAGASPKGKARNLIFFVSDGMSHGTLALCTLFMRDRFERESRWTSWIRDERPRRGLIDTASFDSYVTDSAAASSAWSVGSRVENSSLCVLPDGSAPEPIWLRARRTGRAVGVVTTTRATHATPAGFIANIPDRELEDDIARQYVERGVDLVMGGGARHFPSAMLRDASNITLVTDRDGLLGAAREPAAALASGRRFYGLFAESHMAYEVERPTNQPSLAEMTAAALATLATRDGGFCLQVEAGRVDHAAHNNDAGSIVFDQCAGDAALAACLDWVKGRDDTLLVATTDHGNANPGIQVYGAEATARFRRLQGWRRSYEWLLAQLNLVPADDRTGDILSTLIEHGMQVRLKPSEAMGLDGWLRGHRVELFDERNKKGGALASVMANHVGVAFLGPNHTSDHVECAATGPGSEMLPAFGHLTDVHRMVAAALDLPEAQRLKAPALSGARSKPD